MARSAAREEVFKLVFEYCFSKTQNPTSIDEACENNKKEADYIKTTYAGVVSNFNELCNSIADFAEGFSFSRIFKIDLAIMLLAAYEMKYANIAPGIAINEALNLAKKYSTEKSAGFINGVLAKIAEIIK